MLWQSEGSLVSSGWLLFRELYPEVTEGLSGPGSEGRALMASVKTLFSPCLTLPGFIELN